MTDKKLHLLIVEREAAFESRASPNEIRRIQRKINHRRRKLYKKQSKGKKK